MNNVYFIADLHFGDKDVTHWRGFSSMEEHDNLIISNWNKTVSNEDTVWILGDIALGDESNVDKLGLLNGKKHLILGNHDTKPSRVYLKYVEEICGAHQMDEFILTHIPVHTSQFPRWSINICGHLHGRKINDDRYFCVSVDTINYTPILFSEIKKITTI